MAEQEADLVLRLLDQLLGIGYRLRGGVDQLLPLANLQKRGEAALFPVSDELQRALAGGQRAPGNLQLHVQFEQAEVCGGYIAHESRDYSLSILFCKEQIRSRRFGRPPQPAPGVNFKGEQVKKDAAECSF